MAYQTVIYLLLCAVVVENAPFASTPCHIMQFQKELFDKTLLLENHFDCPDKGDTLAAGQMCLHLYECPLDMKKRIRHEPAICKSDGTWDYIYPTCKDLIPYAVRFDMDLLIKQKRNIIEKRRRRRRTKRAMEVLRRYRKEIPIQESLGQESHGTNLQVKKYASGWHKPPVATTTPPPETAAKEKLSYPNLEQVHKMCWDTHTCKVVNSNLGCNSLKGVKDMELFYAFCDICVLTESCKKYITMF